MLFMSVRIRGRAVLCGLCGLVISLFLLFTAVTWDRASAEPMGLFVLAETPELVTIHYRSKEYFLPSTFARSKGDGIRFRNDSGKPLKLKIEKIESEEVISVDRTIILPGAAADVRFYKKGVWLFYNEEDRMIRGHIYIR
jgi:hypothetical protein